MISHLWPGITPFNVWDLPYGVWRGYAQAHDSYVAELNKSRG